MNALFGQSQCIITPNGTAPNPHRWSEHFNLLVLDHPIGTGYSYGTRVNNSRTAALDVYDFLQKFFKLFPFLARNQFTISGGSYGGIYVPNIATVIQEQNRALSSGAGYPGAIHINLESLILSNPLSDPMSHFRWVLHYRCFNKSVYNSTTCTSMFSVLPTCLESLELAFQYPSIDNRVLAADVCFSLSAGDTHGIVPEDVRRTGCFSDEDPGACHSEFVWVNKVFQSSSTKEKLGIPAHVNFSALNMKIYEEFYAAGDIIQQHHLLYPPLLEDGVRLLHYIGAQDANCGWPGILSFLKVLRSPFQKQFLEAEDVPWSAHEGVKVRAVGEGAGNFTLIILEEAGHFTVKDQPAIAKSIVEHWIKNRPFSQNH